MVTGRRVRRLVRSTAILGWARRDHGLAAILRAKILAAWLGPRGPGSSPSSPG